MPTKNKQSCPTCGQSVNKRIEVLTRNLVTTLFRVSKWAQEKNLKEPVKRSEFAHLVSGTEANTANFAKLAWFAPQFFNNLNELGDKAPSYYDFNYEEIAKFFAGKSEVATVCLIDPLAPTHDEKRVRQDFRKINQIPKITQFLDENKNFIVEYVGRAGYDEKEAQAALSFDKF